MFFKSRCPSNIKSHHFLVTMEKTLNLEHIQDVSIPKPPIHSQTGHWYIPKTIYFQPYINYRLPRKFSELLPLRNQSISGLMVLCVKVEHNLMNYFCLCFWGGFQKMAIKSSTIGQIHIPYLIVTLIFLGWHASVSQQHLLHKHVLCEYCLNGSKVPVLVFSCATKLQATVFCCIFFIDYNCKSLNFNKKQSVTIFLKNHTKIEVMLFSSSTVLRNLKSTVMISLSQ